MVFSKAFTNFQHIQIRKESGFRHANKGNDYRYFTIAGMRKNFAVVPLVAIMTVAVTGICGYIVYACRSRTDVRFKSMITLGDTMDVMNPSKNKMRVFNQEYKPMPELNEALKACKTE